MSEEIKIITLGDIFKNIETEEKAFKFKDYIKHLQQKVEQQEKEIDRLNNIINETRRVLGQYAHYSTPTEEQNAKNEAIVDEAYIQLHGNVAKELKEGNK